MVKQKRRTIDKRPSYIFRRSKSTTMALQVALFDIISQSHKSTVIEEWNRKSLDSLLQSHHFFILGQRLILFGERCGQGFRFGC